MRGRVAAGLVSALILVVAGCSGDPDGPGGPGDPRSIGEAPTVEPGPTALLNPTPEEYAAAAAQVDQLTLPELAGQVIVANYSGTGSPVGLVEELHLGGVIVFDANVASLEQIAASNQELRDQVDRPLMIGVDQEGGVVARIKQEATRFPTFMSAGAADQPELTQDAARAAAAELAGLGFTTAFAPSADVTTGADDPTIGSRSAGSDPELVAEHLLAASDGISEAGLLPVAKHFPGHGSVPADSHHELPVQTRSRAELDATDLAPFREAVDGRVPAIMVGHIDVPAIDPGVPASLSQPVVNGVLREELDFGGLVVTDALDMAGVQAEHDSAESAVLALRAGVDVLLMPPSPRAARDGIVTAVEDGTLDRARLEEAATRLVAHLLRLQEVDPPGADPGSGQAASQALSAAAITMVAGPCSGNLVTDGIRVLGSSERAARLEEAARQAGVPVGTGKTVLLAGYGQTSVGVADIVVATDTPYVLGSSDAEIRIATYGDTPGAMAALVDVLTGAEQAPGQLPVDVPGVPRTGC